MPDLIQRWIFSEYATAALMALPRASHPEGLSRKRNRSFTAALHALDVVKRESVGFGALDGSGLNTGDP